MSSAAVAYRVARARRLLAALACGLLLAGDARAAGPQLQFFFPPGGQIGASIEVAAQGTFERWPMQVWVDRPGLSMSPKEEKGKLAANLAAGAVPGVYWLRLYDAEGATAPVPFFVGNLPEVVEQEPNDDPRKPQELAQSEILVNGRLGQRGDVDTFALRLERGQTLVAAIEANRTLGAPLDAVLQIVSAAGIVLEQNDDDQGLDPRVVFVAPQSETYLVRTFGFPAAPDSSISLSGGDSYLYRLTITTGGFVDYSLPLAVSRGASTAVELLGWNLPPDARHLVVDTVGDASQALLAHPRLANVLVLPIEPHPSIVESEPNDSGHPQPIDLPVTVTGRIEEPRGEDVFRFAARAGQSLAFRVESRTLGYPLDPVLELSDAQGKSLTRVDDSGDGRDAELTYAVGADGTYCLRVFDLHRQGGPRYIYRLRAGPVEPDFRLALDAHALAVQAGAALEIPVKVERLYGCAEEIAVHVEGLPGGTTAATVKSLPEGDTAKALKLVVVAGGEPYSGPIGIVGETAGPHAHKRRAQAPIPGRTMQTDRIWLTVLPPSKK